MKAAAKVLIWITVLFTFWLIVPAIVGVKAVKALDYAQRKEDLQTMAILTLIFCNTIAGILMLCITDADIQRENALSQAKEKTSKYIVRASAPKPQAKPIPASTPMECALKDAKRMFDEGVLTEEEYQKMRASIIQKYC